MKKHILIKNTSNKSDFIFVDPKPGVGHICTTVPIFSLLHITVEAGEVCFCVRVPAQVSPLHKKGVLAHLLNNNTSQLHCHAKLGFIGHVHTHTHTDDTSDWVMAAAIGLHPCLLGNDACLLMPVWITFTAPLRSLSSTPIWNRTQTYKHTHTIHRFPFSLFVCFPMQCRSS